MKVKSNRSQWVQFSPPPFFLFSETSCFLNTLFQSDSRSQWPCGLRRMSAAARLLRSWVRIPPRAWMFVCCDCGVLSGRGLCDEMITRPEESYQLWCVAVCDLETSRMRRTWPALGRSATEKKVKYLLWLLENARDVQRDIFRLFWSAGEKKKCLEERKFIIGKTLEATEKLTNELEESEGTILSRPRLFPSKCFPTIFHA